MLALMQSSPRAASRGESSRGFSLSALGSLLERVGGRLIGDASVSVCDLRQDSRQISRGELFAARPGSRTAGSEHARDAVRRGAAALLVPRGTALPELGVPIVEVDDVRLAIALVAEAIHGHPSRSIGVVGITGTNGKTTSSVLTQHAINCGGGRAARLGTLGFDFEAERVESALTTPEADQISRYAALVRDRGGTHLVMEASSHALSQCRVEALTFAVAAFTNLTQDHLDFHGSMDAYAAAKLRLFTELTPKASVVNVDDPFGRVVAAQARGRLITVSKSDRADVRAEGVVIDARGIRATIVLPSGSVELQTRLTGAHNLDNVLIALAIVDALGLDAARATRGFARAPAVPGRLERCDVPADDVLALVDYAHTPDALERALAAVRPLTSGRVICVFGCGGDRDPTKRPKMGDAVGRGADVAIVTNDNPRSEQPQAIVDAILPGLSPHRIDHQVELDRAKAIDRAIAEADAGDVVLIAGKGHEPYQLIGAERRLFDDRVEARRALARRRERLGR
jgi:UDP-N-acetylmuramoyl-L-alanyl-D-glutamate--2,6-diaminopimelate ligase